MVRVRVRVRRRGNEMRSCQIRSDETNQDSHKTIIRQDNYKARQNETRQEKISDRIGNDRIR
jgi:hypothetical protein